MVAKVDYELNNDHLAYDYLFSQAILYNINPKDEQRGLQSFVVSLIERNDQKNE